MSAYIAATELGAALLVAAAAGHALFIAARERDPLRAGGRLADGVLHALSLLVAAALLKTLFLRSWHDIAWFLLILSLRTGLKRLFSVEAERSIGNSLRC